jgi:hypothetical protein
VLVLSLLAGKTKPQIKVGNDVVTVNTISMSTTVCNWLALQLRKEVVAINLYQSGIDTDRDLINMYRRNAASVKAMALEEDCNIL